ncbi:cystathionine [Nesidiocoris tenuis]|uniref:cystathionine gamma-lyase n=1 Tax=Nesidiocoris tenuis TaxID=355587 RepID=A0ABN7AXW3_9HEMI|nr:cystathionine [Nesidiocoris tenuis]
MDSLGFQPKDESFATRAIHAGQDPDGFSYGPVVCPLYTTTTFKQDAPGQHRGYEYGRSGNPTRNTLEAVLASLDNASHGLCFASGLGATAAINELLQKGDHIVSGDDVYGGTNRYFRKVATNHGVDITFVDTTNVEEITKAIKPNTKMVWLESPTNPMMKITDIPRVSEAIKKTKDDVILVVDNTFLTPYFQRPLKYGADIVVYSLTKYMNGHSDVIMGAITTNRADLFERLQFVQNAAGIVPSPFDCFLVLRSLKTLSVRMDAHMRNAFAVAKHLENHSLVEKVLFPGSESHPQHKLAKSLWSGVSGMISFYLKGGLEESSKFLSSLKVFTLAESLGGYESLAEVPSIMTHASVPPESRKLLGITDNLIRLSVGLESPQCLIADLDQALAAAHSSKIVNGVDANSKK